MDKIQVGDRVRSFDFPGIRDDCYVEGIVLMIGRFGSFGNDCSRYVIVVEKAIREREVQTDFGGDLIVYPPVNGTPTWLGKITDGVIKID